MNFHIENIPCKKEYDVLVCGSGMGGVTAACVAAEQGLKVGIVEYFGEMGGIPVNGRLGSISGFSKYDKQVVGGFALKFAKDMEKQNKAFVQYGGNNINFPPANLQTKLFELIDHYNIDLHLYTQLIGAEAVEGELTHAIVASKSGIEAIKAKLFIDATGDADLANFCNCPFEIGRDGDGKVQSTTLVFIIGGFDKSQMPEYLKIREIWDAQKRNVPIKWAVFQFVPHNNISNEIAINMTHAHNAEPLSSEGLTKMRRECVKQAEEILNFFRNEIKGFENAWISNFAPQMGVRESRRIIGDYQLTEEDVLNAKHFDDEIAQCIWGIDVHTPDGIHFGIDKYIEEPYGIPYRCIIPKNIKNLYIAGRPISATHKAFSSSRINGTCMAIGEAIGIAAPMVIASGDTRKIDIKLLKDKISKIKYSCFS